MNPKDTTRYFDDRSGQPEDAEGRALIELLREVEELPYPEPSPQYWQHFNGRLQQRLSATKTVPWWRRFTWQLAALPFAAAVIALVWMGNLPQPQHDIAALDDEQLLLIASVYAPFESEELSDPFDANQAQLILDTLNLDEDLIELIGDEAPPSGKELQTYWNEEG